MSTKKKLVLEFDDLHWKAPENCFASIKYLVEKYPKIKLSMFTVAEHSGLPLFGDLDWCNQIRSYIERGNLELCVHGLKHTQEEFRYIGREEIKRKLIEAEATFKTARLSFKRVFRGPHWGINNEVYDVCVELGYSHIYTHEDYKHLAADARIKSIFYNWNLKDPVPPDENLVIGHGHTHSVCGNGISDVLVNIEQVIDSGDYEFLFASEV